MSLSRYHMPLDPPAFSIQDWRKRFQQQANWTRSLRQYLLSKAGLKHSGKILEVGCGPGVILDEITKNLGSNPGILTQTYPQSNLQIFGLDIRMDYLKLFADYHSSIHLSQGDGHNLPYPDGAFDFVICHYLLMWVESPEKVTREMQRVCRDGGSVLALAEPDYGGRIDYPTVMAELGKRQRQALIMQGADPDLGRKLGWLFSQAGLQGIETGVMGGQWSDIPSHDEWVLEWQVLAQDLGHMITPGEWLNWKEAEKEAYQNRSRVLYVPTFYAWGKK